MFTTPQTCLNFLAEQFHYAEQSNDISEILKE